MHMIDVTVAFVVVDHDDYVIGVVVVFVYV